MRKIAHRDKYRERERDREREKYREAICWEFYEKKS